MAKDSLNDLYDFAVRLYQDESVSTQCLDLQDSDGASVNVVLWLCWLHANEIKLRPSALTQALNVVGGVNLRLLSGLRELRNELRASDSFTRVQEQLIRKHILSAELAIEKIMLQRLQDLTNYLPVAGADEDHLTLFDYLSHLRVTDSGEKASFFIGKIEAANEPQQVEELSA